MVITFAAVSAGRACASSTQARGVLPRAATTEAKRAGRAPSNLNLTLALSRADIAPEQPDAFQGFTADGDAQRWLISELNHKLHDRGGYSTAVKLELRGEAPPPA